MRFLIVLGVVWLFCGVFAQEGIGDCFVSEMPRDVLVSAGGAELYSLDPYVECGEWSVWISAGRVCTVNTPMCVFYTGGRRLEDLYRTRMCRNTITGNTYQQAEFKTAGAGCCGDPLILYPLRIFERF